ncbi:MAG: adenosylcobinamide-GDP ribazoletransferase [Deltaproteobacteria bacterium]|nr:adenosylcobinamide-GDP ribazoletransferase [Deltaproteobacteria bacterium]
MPASERSRGRAPIGDKVAAQALPLARDCLTAAAALTALPLRRPDPRSPELARSSLFFPLLGLLIGSVLLAVNALIAWHLSGPAAALCLVVVWAAIGRDWSGGAATWPVVIFLAALKWWCLWRSPAMHTAAFLFAPLLGRWSMVVLATGARDADNPGRKFNPGIRFREFALTSVITAGVLMTLAQFLGIVVFVAVAAVVLAARLAVHRWLGGIRWSLLLIASSTVELLVLWLLTLLAGGVA